MTPPAFYPAIAAPEMLRPIYQFNPLGAVIETSRAIVTGQPVEWGAWGIVFGFCLLAAILGYAFFQHSRDEFADAL